VSRGLDVSQYQATVDWAQVKTAGAAFGFARISDGTANPDAFFAANWRGMQSHGIVRGAYQYFRASVDPTAQADLVAMSLQSAGGLLPQDLPVVLDIETADGQPESTVAARMQTWLGAVEAHTGRKPIVYTSAGTYPVTSAAFASYPLWVANYGATCPSLPNGWSAWRFWQTTSSGGINGVSGAVDLDEFDGTLAELTAFAGGSGSEAGLPGMESDAMPLLTRQDASASDAAGGAMGQAGRSDVSLDAGAAACAPRGGP
jgi:lysozyme